MIRVRHRIEWTISDWIAETLTLLIAGSLIYSQVIYYGVLPERIPLHFNFSGDAIGYGAKEILWNLPITTLVLYLGLTILNRFPHIFNYPTEITEANAQRHYRNATRMIRALKFVIVSGFTLMHWRTIQTAIGNEKGLSSWFSPIFIGATAGVLIIYLALAFRNK